MSNLWTSRDLPVLKAVVKLADTTQLVQASQVETETGFDRATVDASLKALKDAGYFTKTGGSMSRLIDDISGVTEKARHAAGVWPTAEQIAAGMLEEIERRAESDPDPEKRSRFKKIAAGFAEGGKDVGINLLAAVVAKSMGL